MIHRVSIYYVPLPGDVLRGRRYELATAGTAVLSLFFPARSSSELKIAPQVLQRHPVIDVRATLAALIREGLKDRPSSPPHCKHKRLGKCPLFWGQR